jgi:hypothetical protein
VIRSVRSSASRCATTRRHSRLRAIAMAQLGDYERARKLLQRARAASTPESDSPQARCQVAEADLRQPCYSRARCLSCIIGS